MDLTLRRFKEEDIPLKVKWINDPDNNRFLHYDLPLRHDKTLEWFNSIKFLENRLDLVIEVEGRPIGLIGLLNINYEQKDAEYYITIGEKLFKGKGIAKKATLKLLELGRDDLQLNKLYLFTEVENTRAQSLFESVGFVKCNYGENEELFYNNRFIKRYKYEININ